MKKLLAALLFVPLMAQAEFWSGNDLYNKLSSNEFMERTQGIGYIMGVYDVAVHVHFCPASEKSITVGQLRDMMFNWLQQNPARRHELAEKLVLDVFRQTWPCANRTPGRGA